MSPWTEEELRRIGDTQELEIAAVRRNGELRRPRPIWVVRVGDEVYVRAAYGRGSGWYTAARASGRAQIRVGGIERDVTVQDPGAGILDAVDAAYREKYARYASLVDKLNEPEHRANTVRLVPRDPA